MRFRFRWIPFIVTVLLVTLGISLGNWQQRRAAEKIALQKKLAAGNAAAPLVLGPEPVPAGQIEFRRVSVSGQFVAGWPLYLDNRPYNGRAGFYVLMPFRIQDSTQHVLVERGWLPRNSVQRDKLPSYTTPEGTVTIEGLARRDAGHVMQLGSAPPLRPYAIVQNAAVDEVSAASGLRLQPFVLEQTSTDAASQPGTTAEPLVRDWPAPSLGVETHRGYAFQWYALTAMALLFFVVTGFRRGTN
jgi:cytochrome oxidase assembly protein ShyY1